MKEHSRGQTTDLVRLRILEDIRDGFLVPGAKLATEQLARRYQVSRTPVREALIRLEQDGLAESTPNAGCVLRALSLEEICDIYEIREALEGMAVERIVRHGVTPELVAELKETCRIRRREGADLRELEAGDLAFHQALCRHCGSAAISGVIDNCLILSTIFSMLPLRAVSRRRLDGVTREHETIIAAMEAGNSRLARRLLVAHIAAARKRLARCASSGRVRL